MRKLPWPALMSSPSMCMPRTRFSALEESVSRKQFRIGQHEIRRRDRVGDLLDVEGGLGARVLVDAVGVLDQMVGPIGGEQIGLLEEIEELVLRPFRIGKALVARVGAGDGARRLAGHALDRARPQIEIGAAEIGLQFERALGVGQPVFRHLADGLDHVGDVVGQVAFDLAVLARLHVGGERLAAFLDHPGKVAREHLDIDGADFCRFVGGLVHAREVPALQVARTVPHRKADFSRIVSRSRDAPQAAFTTAADLAAAILAG